MKNARFLPFSVRQVISGVSVLLLLIFSGGAPVLAQDYPLPPDQAQQAPLLSPDQLSNLVAPIALYPDNLLSQVLVASTYPLEVVEAAQWLQQHPGLTGQVLIDSARQQNWDPSIQALVVFPDVLNRLAWDVQWTTALGNAFLAQQGDLMAAVQQLRAEAQAAGKLNSNSQQIVTTESQNGHTVIVVQPANLNTVYVPYYNPEYVWGPPVYGYYPPLYYPDIAFGFGFGPPCYIGGFFGGLGWANWGWGPSWFGGVVITRPFFFAHYGFRDRWDHDRWGGGYRGGVWTHDPDHRWGVPYNNRAVASRFGGNFDPRGGLGGAALNNGFRGSDGYTRNQGGFTRGDRGQFNGGARPFAPQGNGTQGGWRGFNHPGFNQPNPGAARPAHPNFRSNPSLGGGSFRPAPSAPAPQFRGGAMAPAPQFRSNPPFGGGSFRPAPSAPAPQFRGGAMAPAPQFRSNPSFGGGSFRPAPSAPAPEFRGGGMAPAPRFRSNPSFDGGNSFRPAPSAPTPSLRGASMAPTPAFRSAPSFGGGNSFRSAPSAPAPAYHSSPSFGGGHFSAPPSGGFTSRGNVGWNSFHGGGGSGVQAGGGSGFHGGGGGGVSHGSGRR
jgi:hypothetical protein